MNELYRQHRSSALLSKASSCGGCVSTAAAATCQVRNRSLELAWLLALVITSHAAAESGPGQSKLPPGLFQSDLFFHSATLEDELRLNRRALEVAGPSRRASLWVDRAMLYAQAGHMGPARQALTAARAVAGLVSSTAEAQVLIQSGARLLAIEILEDAASYFEDAAKLIDPPGSGKQDRQMLQFAYSRLFQIYGRLGLDDLKGSAKDKLECLSGQTEARDVLELIEFLALNESFQESASKESELPEVIASIKNLVELYKGSKNARNRQLGQFLEAFVQLFDAIQEEESIEKAMRRIRRQVDDPQLKLFLNLIAPMVEAASREAPDEIFDAFEQMMELFPPETFSSRLLQAKLLLSRTLMKVLVLKQPAEESAAAAREAIVRFESYVEGMRVDEARTGFIDDEGYMIYRIAVEVLARANLEEGFDYAERGRAWTLRRLLGNPRQTYSGQEVVSETDRLRGKITAPGTGLAPVEPVTLEQLQREILPPDTTLIAYFPGFRAPGVPQLRIWAVDRDGIEAASILMPTEGWQDIACLIQALRWQQGRPRTRQAAKARGALILPGCHDLLEDPAGALYRRLVAPVAPHLTHKRVIIVPHGLLHRVPFAALSNPETGQYLIQDYILSTAPSLSALARLSEDTSSSRGAALVIGDPDSSPLSSLAGARQEAETVAKLLESETLDEGGTLTRVETLLGGEATESAVHKNVDRIRLLHLAAHGRYVAENPRLSRIHLTADDEYDGTLEVREIWDRLDLRGTELVVLSGCETGVAEVTRGDDALGLTYAFLVAGSRAVISTLWPVDDLASSEFMTAFYRGYIDQRQPAAEALRAAQLKMLERDETQAPYYWAGFTLTGDPTSRWLRHQIQRDDFPGTGNADENEPATISTCR